MLHIRYLKDEHLKGFEKYKYSCVDTSYLSRYVMHPFWNYCVRFFPRWMAPNLITFTGFLLTISNFFIIGYYDYDFTAVNENKVIPNWVWIVAAVNIFLAYTLDGIDGKQARRTGTSSPLGELFDHGVDSYSAAVIPIYMFSLFGSDAISPIRMFFVVWNVFLNFFLTHFEKYNTGVLFLPWAYDCTMWGVSITLFITGIFGTDMWKFRLPGNMTTATAFELTLYISGIVSSHPFIVHRIYNSYKNGTGKMRSLSEALLPLQPFVGMFVITTIWMLFSVNNICNIEPRMLFLLFGTVFSNICCRLIVAQMSDTRADKWNQMLWLILSAAILALPWDFIGLPTISKSFELAMIYTLTIVCTIIHVHYSQGVVCEMCNHFKIRCFKIKAAEMQTIDV